MALAKTVYLSLGSNIGERKTNLERAVELLASSGISVVKTSSIYETAPQQVKSQPWFLNLVLETTTSLFPLQLLSVLQNVERQLGRERRAGVRFGPRTIDLDILLYGRSIIETPTLTVPHPRMTVRRFVLEPLVELAPELRDPVSGRPYRDLLNGVKDQAIRRFLG
jgi:2-amino-4-hydroxy-6-hydroxymethyldihydropteridine diphosphokinase